MFRPRSLQRACLLRNRPPSRRARVNYAAPPWRGVASPSLLPSLRRACARGSTPPRGVVLTSWLSMRVRQLNTTPPGKGILLTPSDAHAHTCHAGRRALRHRGRPRLRWWASNRPLARGASRGGRGKPPEVRPGSASRGRKCALGGRERERLPPRGSLPASPSPPTTEK